MSPVLGWDLGAILAPPTPADLRQESWGSGASRREGSLRFTAKTKFPLNRPLLAQSKNPFSRGSGQFCPQFGHKPWATLDPSCSHSQQPSSKEKQALASPRWTWDIPGQTQLVWPSSARTLQPQTQFLSIPVPF